MEYTNNIKMILSELSLREVASTTTKHIPNKPALHRSAPETILQLPQQQAEEPGKKHHKRSPKGGQGFCEPELGIWVSQLSGILMREVTVVFRFRKQLGNRKRKKKKTNLSTSIMSQAREEMRHMPPLVLSQHCDTKPLHQMRKV